MPGNRAAEDVRRAQIIKAAYAVAFMFFLLALGISAIVIDVGHLFGQ